LLQTSVAQLEVKSGVWGAAGGILGFILLVAGTWAQSGVEAFMSTIRK
jgi:hypothetical protein